MSDAKLDKKTREGLKSEIESLLQNIGEEDNASMLLDNELSKELERVCPYDFEEMSVNFTKKAKDITDSLFKNFVDVGIFENNDYARHKKELDTINISNLFFQLKTLKITITKVMEEIASGNTHPRLIEVMGQLQDKMASITKMQANYVLFLEETYKKLNEDVPVNPNSVKIESKNSEGQFFISVGTKNVIENLPDVAIEDDDSSIKNLVDPTNKSDLMREKNIKIEEVDKSDDFIDLTEII
jgi:hypothetical protein